MSEIFLDETWHIQCDRAPCVGEELCHAIDGKYAKRIVQRVRWEVTHINTGPNQVRAKATAWVYTAPNPPTETKG